jgi:type I restriction-modification system DNA methylase subunit
MATGAKHSASAEVDLPPSKRWGKCSAIGKAINDAMRAIEAENEDLKDVLPKTYNRLDNSVLVSLLKTLNSVPMDIEGTPSARSTSTSWASSP